MSINEKAAKIKLLLFDVDGVLTNGKILLHADGTESKQFDIKDGSAIRWAQYVGLTVGFLSARTSATTGVRAHQLGVTLLHQGVDTKLDSYDQIIDSLLLEDDQVAYMGDDLLDLPVLMRVGLSAAPADAADEVRARVDLITTARGGDGAARELIVRVLRAQGRWDALLAGYMTVESPAGRRG